MLHRALEQFLSGVHWGELDALVVDMPPRTEPFRSRSANCCRARKWLSVTTPQPAAQQVAVRAAVMAQKTGMHLIGAVENMSFLVGTGQELFGAGGGEALARAIDAPLLGRIPLDPRLRECADAGEPLVWAEPENETARTIFELAEAVTATGEAPGRVKKPLSSRVLKREGRPKAPLAPCRSVAAGSSAVRSAELSGATGVSAPGSPLSVEPTIVADQLPRRRAYGRRPSPVARPSRWFPLSITAERRAFDLGRLLRFRMFAGSALSVRQVPEAQPSPVVSFSTVWVVIDRRAGQPRLRARRGPAPDRVRDAKRVLVLGTSPRVHSRLGGGKRGGHVGGLQVRLSRRGGPTSERPTAVVGLRAWDGACRLLPPFVVLAREKIPSRP